MILFSVWKLYLTAAGATSLDYATTTSYDVSITCTDSGGLISSTLAVTVNVVENELLTLPNVAGAASKNFNHFR